MNIFLNLLWLWLIVSWSFAGESFIGKCVGVADSNNIIVMREGKPVKIRLYGMDAPELSQAFGQKAKKLITRFVQGKMLSVEMKDPDKDGRLVGEVFVKNMNINQSLVDAGYAWANTKDSSKFVKNERRAKEAKLGLWRDKSPVPPWEYRQKYSTGKISSIVSNKSTPTKNLSMVVYITKSDKKYHRSTCPKVKNKKITMSRQDAIAKGYKPCGVCKP